MAFRTHGEFENLAEINITPLVDVMLVLLVIFMVTTPMLIQGLDVDLPKEKAPALQQRGSDPIVLTLTRDRFVLLEDRPVEPSQLAQSLGPLLRGEGRPVYLKADQSLPYGFVVQVLAVLSRIGVEDVGIVTVPPEGR